MLQLLSNFQFIFSIGDVYNYVEIWNKKQAYKIVEILCDVFSDFEFHKKSVFDSHEESDAEIQWKDIINREASRDSDESVATLNGSFLDSTLIEFEECMDGSFVADTIEHIINDSCQ